MAFLNVSLPDDNFGHRMLGQVSRSFALTIPQLPSGLDRTVTNAYLLCRILDTIEDEVDLSLDQKRIHLEEFIAVAVGQSPADQFTRGLLPLLSEQTVVAEKELIGHTADVMRTFFCFSQQQQTIIRRCLETMANGMLDFQKNQNPGGLESLKQLDAYCYYVAGVVGEMLTGLFCDYSQAIARQHERLLRLAPSFGQGLQMTNILKDFWEDRARGVCWLPQEVFRDAGCDLSALVNDCDAPGFGEGLAILVGVARGHLENALAYTLLIPRSESGIRKFCLWAIGMAVFTLRKINNNRDYTCAQDVKISRRTARTIITVSNATLKSNFLLKTLFKTTTYGLPAADF
jgi:farnesyl-diphosphate farnesyltransferase